MKTKYLALAAFAPLFVACSDGIEDFGQAAKVESNRPKATVAINVNKGIENATRFSFENTVSGYKWVFENGDKLGALLMDEWDEQGYHDWKHYGFDDQVHTNYPFTYNSSEDKFYSPDGGTMPVDEGNYFFYYPYDRAISLRGYVGWKVNPVQKNYDPETGNPFLYQAIKDNQRYLGYKFIEGVDANANEDNPEAAGALQSLNIDMVPLFATPLFEWENNTSTNFQVEKLLVRSARTEEGDFASGKHSQLLPTSMILAPETMKFGTDNGCGYSHKASDCDYVNNFDFKCPGDTKPGTYPLLKSGDKHLAHWINDVLDRSKWPGCDKESLSPYEYLCQNFWQQSVYVVGSSYNKAAINHGITNSALDNAPKNGLVQYVLSQGNNEAGVTKKEMKDTFMEDTYQYKVDFGKNYYGQIGNKYLDVNSVNVPVGTKIRASLVMPAGLYTEGFETELYLYQPETKKHYVVRTYFVHDAQTSGYVYGTSQYDQVVDPGFDMLMTSNEHYQKFLVGFDAHALQSFELKDFQCIDNEDLMWVLNQADWSTANKNLEITTTGKNVVLNDEVVARLRELNKQFGKKTISINGMITVNTTDKKAVADLIEFKGDGGNTTLVIASDQDILKTNDPVTHALVDVNPNVENMTVNKGVTVNTNNILVHNELVNNGTINAKDIHAKKIVNAGTIKANNVKADETINNSGSMNVSGTIEAGTSVTNSGNMSANTLKTPKFTNKGTANFATTYADIDNHGTLTVTNIKANSSTDDVQNYGTLNVNNSDIFISNNAGTVNAKGGKLVGAQNNSVFNIEGNTESDNFVNNPNKVVNVKANFDVAGYNEGVMNITAGTTKPTSYGKFTNMPSGTINVTNAELKYVTAGQVTKDLINDGVIDVNGKSHVLVAGTNKSGIIDITDADCEAGKEAKSNDKFGKKMYFRAQKSVTDEFLAKVISSKNINVNIPGDGSVIKNPTDTNPIILQFNADDEQHQVNAQIAKILVTAGTVSIDGTFDQLIPQTGEPDYIGSIHKSIEVKAGALLQVKNINAPCACGSWSGVFEVNEVSDVFVNGKFRAENATKVLGTATVSGNGNVEAGNYGPSFEWQPSSAWKGTWTNE